MRDTNKLSSVQQLNGIVKALDRLQDRAKSHREALKDYLFGVPSNRDAASRRVEDSQITTGEVQTVELLIRRFALRVTGDDPDPDLWDELRPYCSRNEEKVKDGRLAQNYEYFRWGLMWVEKTRSYLEYLSGCQSATGTSQTIENNNDGLKYDVALSFAGEDRHHARKIAQLLSRSGYSVFFDEYEEATLWGRNLYSHLSEVYQNRARYCLMFISTHYARKLWTKRERESAQARAFSDSKEYILPLLLDDTKIPGIETTIAYIDLRKTSHEEVVELLKKKMATGK